MKLDKFIIILLLNLMVSIVSLVATSLYNLYIYRSNQESVNVFLGNYMNITMDHMLGLRVEKRFIISNSSNIDISIVNLSCSNLTTEGPIHYRPCEIADHDVGQRHLVALNGGAFLTVTARATFEPAGQGREIFRNYVLSGSADPQSYFDLLGV